MNNLFLKIASATSHIPKELECGKNNPCPVTSVEGLFGLLTKTFGFFFGVVVALSSIFLLYAAFQYIIARGDEGKIEKAKSIIIYAVVALVVAAIAWAIPAIVVDFVK